MGKDEEENPALGRIQTHSPEINLQYKIEPYDSDYHLKFVPQMRKMNLANVNAALLFFSTLRNDLVSNTPEFLEQELEKL